MLAVAFVRGGRSLTEEDARLLDAIAKAAGVALRVSRLVDSLSHAVEVEHRVTESIAALRAGRSLPDVLETVADSFAALLPHTSCSLSLINPGRTSFTHIAFRGVVPASRVRSLEDLPANAAHVLDVWRRDPGYVFRIPDVRKLPGWTDVVPSGIKVAMVVPLAEEREVIGFVALGRNTEPFTDAEARLASTLADHAAVAVTRTRLRIALESRLRLIETMHRLSDGVVRTSNLRRLIAELNAGVCADVGIECLRVSFENPLLAAHLRAPVTDASERALLQSWRNGEPPSLDGEEWRIPIAVQGRIAGVLHVRHSGIVDPVAREVAETMASGIGEVAWKAKLRRAAETRALHVAVAAERERTIREVHDTVGRRFLAIASDAQALVHEVRDPAVTGPLTEVVNHATAGIIDVREAVLSLSLLNLRAHGFVGSLRALARQFEILSGVGIEFRVDDRFPRPPRRVAEVLYRVAHEALLNVERHARATGVVMLLSHEHEKLRLDIRDDGVGLDQRQVHDWSSAIHLGLQRMARTVEEAGGTFTVRLAEPRGLALQASIPTRRGSGKR